MAETHPEIETTVPDDIVKGSEDPTSKVDYTTTGTDSQRNTASETELYTDDSETDTGGTTIPVDIPQASEIPASEAFVATSTNSVRFANAVRETGESATEGEAGVTTIPFDIAQISEDSTSKVDDEVNTDSGSLVTDESATEGDKDRTTIPNDIPQASEPEDSIFGVDYAKSTTDSERLVTDESEMEGGTYGTTASTEASKELSTAEAEKSATEPEEFSMADEPTTSETSVDGASSDATEQKESLDAFSKKGLDGKTDGEGGDIDKDSGENLLEIAHDTRIFHASEEHLSNFVDIEEDLDFPEGIEGNMPVIVLSPNEDIENK